MRLSSLFILALCHIYSIHGLKCNQNTQYECKCDECWDALEPEGTVDWITVGLSDCPPSMNDTILRKKLAGWVNEECSAVLDCRFTAPVEPNSVIIGLYDCSENSKELRAMVLKNITEGLRQENQMPANLLGLVMQSREHLLSFFLHSELHSVTVYRQFKGSGPKGRVLHTPLIIFSVIFLIFLCLIAVAVYFSQVYINWKHIVRGKWAHKEYHKVPHVRYSTDELESQGHI